MSECRFGVSPVNYPGASFTKQLSKNVGLSFLIEKFTLIPYHKILSLNLRYFMKLAPDPDPESTFQL